jgi:hypothetical protein
LAVDTVNKRLYTENAGGTVLELGTSPSTIDINGGTIDGTVIGGSSAAAITGTTITGTSFVSSGNMTFGDNDKATFGASDDLQIYHDGSNSYIAEGGTGNLQIQGQNLSLEDSTGTRFFLGIQGGETRLYNQGNEKVAVTATGIDVTGDVSLGDNGKAIFGAGSDLQIYHNANNSFIQDAGTGSLYIDGSASVNIRETSTNAPMAVFTGSGSVDLYHNGIKKLETTATGIDVTGIVDASDLVRFGVNNSEIANNYVRFKPSGAAYIDHSVVGQNINFRLSNASSLDKTPLVVSPTGIDVTGTVTMDGLTVSGTTNTPTVFESSAAASYVQFKDSGTTTDNNNRIGSIGDTLTLWSGGSKAVTIDASQRVGINTTSPATALDVTGTVTADGLSVDGAVEVSGTTAQIYLMESDTTDENTRITNAAGNLFIQTTSDDKGTDKTRIFLDHATGDLSLYEDTGTTAKLFWDASAESLGIGTASPAAKIEIGGAGEGIILASPDGTRYEITVANGGTLTVTAV